MKKIQKQSFALLLIVLVASAFAYINSPVKKEVVHCQYPLNSAMTNTYSNR